MRMPSHLLCSLVTIHAALISTSASGQSTSSDPVLDLEEVFSYPVPDSIAVVDAWASSQATLLLWSAEPGGLFLIRNGEWLAIGGDVARNPIAGAVTDGGNVIEVVDSERRSILRFDLTGQLQSEREFNVPLAIEGAARAAGAWFIGGRNAAGDFVVYAFGTDGPTKRLYVLPRDLGERVSAYLAPAGADVLITPIGYNSTATRISSDGRIRRVLQPPADSVIDAQHRTGRPSRWISLRSLALDRGYIRMLSDLASDDRVLLLYDDAGNIVRHRFIDIPFGLVASSSEQQLLVAARHLHRTEIVGFRWRWRN